METNVDTHRPPRRRVRRAGQSVLVAGLTLLAVASASPAGAAEPTPGLRWRYDRGEELQDARLSGKVRLRAEVSTEAPVDGWSITVVTPSGEPVFGTVCDERFKRPRSEFWVDCRWDTGRYADQGPSANGRYLIRVMARQGDGLQPVGPDRAVAVTNAASAPQDVTMSYDEVGERATLTWLPNPEPDVARYDVEEEIKGNWTRVAETTEPRFETRLTDAAHRFRVAAERRNADGAADGPGPWSVAAQPRQSGRPSRKEATRRERSDSRSESARTPSPERREATATTGTAPATTPANTEQPAARTAASGAPRTPNPPPAESAGLAFSPSSAGAFSALADTHVSAPVGRKATAGPSTRPATAPPASPTALGLGEPDTGFQETLPYPQPEE
ncbi:MAG TPA: hypothetical protein VFS16_13275, partial [Acidimicrobiia bacterium]|nr:hypothetical protein [Acidimicrobiia bacterium]